MDTTLFRVQLTTRRYKETSARTLDVVWENHIGGPLNLADPDDEGKQHLIRAFKQNELDRVMNFIMSWTEHGGLLGQLTISEIQSKMNFVREYEKRLTKRFTELAKLPVADEPPANPFMPGQAFSDGVRPYAKADLSGKNAPTNYRTGWNAFVRDLSSWEPARWHGVGAFWSGSRVEDWVANVLMNARVQEAIQTALEVRSYHAGVKDAAEAFVQGKRPMLTY